MCNPVNIHQCVTQIANLQSNNNLSKHNTPRFYSNSVMSIESLESLWNTLQNVDNKSDEDLAKEIQSLLKYPPFVYRYRSVDEKNLDSLLNNKLYFSRADYYDDPFDPFLYINLDQFKEYCSNNNAKTHYQDMLDQLKSTFETSNSSNLSQKRIRFYEGALRADYIVKDYLDEMIDFRFSEHKKESLQNFQKLWFSICFSSDDVNETLWQKYANHHRGFVLGYDTDCFNKNPILNNPLYPIFYTDNPYTISNELAYKMYFGTETTMPNFSLGEKALISLTKKSIHHYDQEWRVIASDHKMPEPLYIVPDSVTLGFRMSALDRRLVIAMSQLAGIQEINQIEISYTGELEVQLLMFYDSSKGKYALTPYARDNSKRLEIDDLFQVKSLSFDN